MKKLSKVLLLIAIILMIALPLSAAKTMSVKWQWLLNDPYVISYRYQLNGEAEDGWTMVDAKTDVLLAEGLDPYADYTLYLQCTYDGVIWSESAKSTAYALLEYVEVEKVEEKVEEVVSEAEAFSGFSSFDVFGFEVDNSWYDGEFVTTTAISGILTESDVRGFALYEVEKYGEVLTNNVSVSFIPDGMTLTYPKNIDPSLYLSLFRSDIEEYISTLSFSSTEKTEVETAEKEEIKVEETALVIAPVFSTIISSHGLSANVVAYSDHAEITVPAGTTKTDVDSVAAALVKAYPVAAACTYSFDGSVVSLSYPPQSDEFIVAAVKQLESDAKWALDQIYGQEVAKAEAEAETAPVVEEVAVEEPVPETASFSVFGFTVENSWINGTFVSKTEKSGILTEDDVRSFALYEIAKYGDALTSLVSISFVEDGFELTYPVAIDPSLYINQYKSDIEEYGKTLFAPVEVVEEVTPQEEAAVEVPPAPAEPEVVDVPAPAEVVEVVVSPVVEKLASYNFKLGLSAGSEFAISNATTGVSINPRLGLTLDFQNVVSASRFGFGTRFDIAGTFRPADGTFSGHDFSYFLNFNNWDMDLTADAKLMVYYNFDKAVLYAGGGIGYSIATAGKYSNTHSSEKQLFGFDTALVLTGVAGIDWRVSNSVSLSLEFVYRNFFQSVSKAHSLNAVLGIGFNF